MIRWVFFLKYPEGVSFEEGERWYLGTHTQEAKTLRGLRRYVTWRTEPAKKAPVWSTVERLNQFDRVTELWFDDWESWHEAAIVNPPKYTPAPYGDRGFLFEALLVDEQPDENFLGEAGIPVGAGPELTENLIRWLFVLRYRDETPFEEGEKWYLGTHTQEAKHMIGLRRYVSWRGLDKDGFTTAPGKWHRLTELTFDGWEGWEEGAVDKMPQWTPPSYGGAGFLSETAFIREQPQYDLLKDVPEVP